MNNASPRQPEDTGRSYDDASQALRDVIEELGHCSDSERDALKRELELLERMTEKLDSGRVEIVIFGEIDTGKSALINALIGEAKAQVSIRGGWTREVWHVAWDGAGYQVPGLAESGVTLVDTPGINEVQGEERATMAREAAAHADLILFVTDSDFNDVEFAALKTLAQSHKPVLVVLNKTDLYRQSERDELRDTLEERLKGIVEPRDIIETQADPRPIQVVIESPDGSTREEERQPSPKTDDLKQRILQVLEQEGKALLALNAAMFAADTSDKIASTKVRLREQYAQRLIWTFAATKAIAVAVNPIPVADVVGGSAVDASMVVALSRVYRIQLSRHNAAKLIQTILLAAGGVTLSELGTAFLASLFKGLTAGASTAVSAPIQAAAAGYGSYIVGQAAKFYLEHGASWAGRSPKSVVREILDQTDREGVVAGLKEEIKSRLSRNPHAKE